MAYITQFNARNVSGLNKTVTPQSQPILGREPDMVKNRAGGFVFAVDCWTRLSRFLILGSDSNTYYASAKQMTLSNIEGILLCLEADGARVVREIVEVSKGGRAPKNDPALYALAIATAFGVHGQEGVWPSDMASLAERLVKSGNLNAKNTRSLAFNALPDVARTGTHLMQFIGFMESVRGWGRGPRRAVQAWFDRYSDERLALQAVKYRQRDGWTLGDILRLASPKFTGEDRRVLIEWILRRDLTEDAIARHESLVQENRNIFSKGNQKITQRRHAVRPGSEVIRDASSRFRLIDGYHQLLNETNEAKIAQIVRQYSMPFECVPSHALNNVAVWDALLVDMPMTNMIRNLGKMTATGLLAPLSDASRFVCERLRNQEALVKARVHPYQLLVASRIYATGHGDKGSLTWTPNQKIIDALDDAFYLAFKAVEPTGKRFMLGIDVSGSMGASKIQGGVISAREGAGAMAMVTSAVEPETFAVGFTAGSGSWIPSDEKSNNNKSFYGRREDYGVTPIALTAHRRLSDFCREMAKMPMGATDCALPVLYALENNIRVDAFVIYTDNESWKGNIHVTEALTRYRDKMGIMSKLVAVAMTATEYSVADAKDAGQMDVVGFDTNAPALISNFVR